MNSREKDGRVLHQQWRGAAVNLGVGHTQHAAIILILSLIEGEQPVILCLENRLVDREGLALTFVDGAHIDGERKLAPGRLHLAVREEKALDDPGFLFDQEVPARHALPSKKIGGHL